MKISSEQRRYLRKIGRRGAHRRALLMSPEQRRAQAVKAITMRWERVRAQQQATEQVEQSKQAQQLPTEKEAQ